MQEISDLFEVSAVSPEGLTLIGKGQPGFRIPAYQRPYDWDADHILRLMTGMFSGLERLGESTNADAYSFLGTIILVRDTSQEPTFNEQSFSVVDGQQRITTLSLMACAIIEQLRLHLTKVPSISEKVNHWLQTEVEYIERCLIKSVVGRQDMGRDRTFPFPRVIRDEDTRGTSVKEQETNSYLSKFLCTFFSSYYCEDEVEFVLPNSIETRESRKISENFFYIRELLENLNNPEWHEKSDSKFLLEANFKRKGLKGLLEKMKDTLRSDGEKEISEIQKSAESHSFFRMLLFAGYFCNCVGITVVTTDDESAAFDIFDALNTTGEPLSAIEVLKPVVVSALDKASGHPGYKKSEAEEAFNLLDQIFEDENYTNTQAKQDETKRTVVTSSLVIAGDKVAEKLSIQRTQIRKYFATACKRDLYSGEQFVVRLAQVAEFRRNYWNDTSFGRLTAIHASDLVLCNELKLSFSFLTAMKTPMALPILARFWMKGSENGDFSEFLAATKAVCAFVALRRGATEKADGIDTCFRDLMGKHKFCTGIDSSNPDPTLPLLKKALAASLDSKKLKFSTSADRDKWVNHCVDVPIYSAAQPLAKFLLLASHDKTDSDAKDPSLPSRTGAVVSEEREFLTYEKWADERYKTVEHIAPNSAGASGWPKSISENARIRNSIGNLTLLPSKENNEISNSEWEKKKLFFAALSASTKAERESQLKKAETALAKPFRKQTWQVVNRSPRLSMLDGINLQDEWNKEFVERRSKRLLELAWDKIFPWLEV
ncbi:DUF262 domain-containing protein [Falsiruegeria mediterranea]|uniref:DUF262 domain-containing protein n=1 Tax=Falsiruegeria mediterranea TaxID=1280832 RepID=UPI0015F26F91|nr:DUF262 domain-containing protein [Falsiruegeria mediterranea]